MKVNPQDHVSVRNMSGEPSVEVLEEARALGASGSGQNASSALELQKSAEAMSASAPVSTQGTHTAVEASSSSVGPHLQPLLANDGLLKTVPIPADSMQPILVGPAPHPSMLDSASPGALDSLPTAGGFFFTKPMAAIEFLLTSVHEATGMPWWMTIASTTMGLRLAVVPMQIYQSKAIARMAIIKPQMDELTTKMRAEGAKGTDKGAAEAQKAHAALSALMTEHNVSPWKTIVGAVGQIPLWLSFFFTMRHIVRPDSGLGLDSGGLLWFSDLTSRDPYFVLPVVCGSTFFGMVSLGDAGSAGAPVDPKQEQMKTFMKGIAVLMVPATAWFESGVFVYWISTNLFSMLQVSQAHRTRQTSTW